MERREQRQVVVMHPAGVDSKFGVRGASAEENHAPAAPDIAKGILPSLELSGGFDYEIGTEAGAQARDFSRGVFAGQVDHPAGTQFGGRFETIFAAANDYDVAQAALFEREQMKQSESAGADDHGCFKLFGPSGLLRVEDTRQRLKQRRLVEGQMLGLGKRVAGDDAGGQQQIVGISAPYHRRYEFGAEIFLIAL